MCVYSLFLSLLCSTLVAVAASKSSIHRASFVPPASPRLISSSSKQHAPTAVVASGYGLGLVNSEATAATATTLFAKKKASGTAAASPKKMQVKMLKHVAGTGQAGQVVMVTPAFFNNKLRPTKSAELISDEEVQQEREADKAKQEALNKAATEAKHKLEGNDDDDRFTLMIHRKSGPTGQLFGGISSKNLMEELSVQLPMDIWEEKGVKIIAIMDEKGKKIKGDIKHVGKYQAQVSLTKEISGKFDISIEEE